MPDAVGKVRAAGLTASADLAEALGVSRRSVQRWIRHETEPSRDLQARLLEIAAVLERAAVVLPGGPADAALWLRTPSGRLGWQPPLDLISQGRFREVIGALAMGEPEVVSDSEGYPVKEGAPVVAWFQGESFPATVKVIKPFDVHDFGPDGPRRIVLVRDDDRTEAERWSNQVIAVVGNDEVLEDIDLTAVIATHAGDCRAVIRLSGRARLQPVDAGQAAADPRTQQLRDALLAIPQVTGVAVVATYSNRKRDIVVQWEAGADRVAVSQAAWQAVSDVIPGIQLRRAFWQ